MPTIHVSKKAFEQYVGKALPLEKLKDRISYLGTDLEGIEGDEITVEIFPNRPDMLSTQGFARAFSSFIGHTTGLKQYQAKDSKQKVIIEKPVSKVRPYTACAIVKNLKFNDQTIKEVIDIQEKLHVTFGRNRKKVAIGIYPLEKIMMPITFTAKKPKDIVFQPLESDKEMNATQILKEHPTGQKYGPLLDGYDTFPVFLDANGKVLSVPPIINSHDVGKITQATTEVFVECSGHEFEPQHEALIMIVTALADMGATVESMTLEYPDKKITTPDLNPKPMKVNIDYLNKLLGLSVDKKQFKTLIEKMGYGYEKDSVLIPCYRADILHQVDIGEDLAIAYGFENFTPEIPKVATVAQEHPLELFKDKLANLLVGLQFQETSTYNLTNEEYQSKRMLTSTPHIKLANAISQEYDVLRAWVLPNMLEIFSQNKHHEFPQKIFTCGRTFHKDAKQETGVREEQWISCAVSSEKADYTSIRQIVDYLLSQVGITTYTIKEHDAPYFISGRAAQLIINGKHMGFFGEVNPQVLDNWDIKMPTVAAELSIEALKENL